MSSDDEDTRQLELRTFTSLWQVEKRIYKIYDFALPMPISLRMLGIMAVTFIPWVAFLLIIRFPFNIESITWILWIAPPAAIAYFANRPIAEGKSLFDLTLSQSTFFLGQPNYYARMEPWSQPTEFLVTGYTWEPAEKPEQDDLAGVGDTVNTETSRELEKPKGNRGAFRNPFAKS